MVLSYPDEDRLKALLKEAMTEVLEQRREWLVLMLIEALEDSALVRAIKEGESSEIVSRDDIFALLEK